MKVTKDQGINISLAAVLSWLPLIPVFWFLVKPVLVTAVSEAVAGDIQQQVASEVEPINNAFVALLQRDINSTKKEIATLEFRERQGDDWTEEDAAMLADMEIQLDALKEAKDALQAERED